MSKAKEEDLHSLDRSGRQRSSNIKAVSSQGKKKKKSLEDCIRAAKKKSECILKQLNRRNKPPQKYKEGGTSTVRSDSSSDQPSRKAKTSRNPFRNEGRKPLHTTSEPKQEIQFPPTTMMEEEEQPNGNNINNPINGEVTQQQQNPTAAGTATGAIAQQTNERGNNSKPSKPAPTASANVEVNKLSGVVFAEKYKLMEKLGSGAFGVIYRAKDLKNECINYGCKVEKADTKHPQIIFEARLYNYLHNNISRPAVGIPRCYFSDRQGEYNIMIMDLLGMSLEQLFNFCNRSFSLKTTLMLADQLLTRVEFLHSRNFLHRDIKPDNFLIGTGKRENRVYMIDFGLAKRFIKDSEHIPYKDGKNLTGTARYASINTHVGIEQSRRDDLESLAYMLIYFLKGQLPWQNIRAKDKKEKYERIKLTKQAITTRQLCTQIPEEFVTFLDYTKSLEFTDKPDYFKCKQIFRDLMKKSGYEYDWIWDWKDLDTTSRNKSTSQNPKDPLQQQQQRIPKELIDPNTAHQAPNLIPEARGGSDQKPIQVPRTRNTQNEQIGMNGFEALTGSNQRQTSDIRNGQAWSQQQQQQQQSSIQLNQHTELSPRTGFRNAGGVSGGHMYQQLQYSGGIGGSGSKNQQQTTDPKDPQRQEMLSIMMTKEGHLMNSSGKPKELPQQSDQAIYSSPFMDSSFKNPVPPSLNSTSALAKQGNSIINNTAQMNFYQAQQQQQQQQQQFQQQYYQAYQAQTNMLAQQQQQQAQGLMPQTRMTTSSGFTGPNPKSNIYGMPVNPNFQPQPNPYMKNVNNYPLPNAINNTSNVGSRDISRDNGNLQNNRGNPSSSGNNNNQNQRYE